MTTSKDERDWAQIKAEHYLSQWNPRFALYREQDATFRQDEIDRLAQALREAQAQGQAKSHADCELGEPLMHGPHPYPWCRTHKHLMMACDMRFRGKPALDVAAASREVAAMTEFALCARPLSVIEHEIAAILARHFRAESRWQRIETVPKDGTAVLLGRSGEEPWVDEWMADEGIWMMCDQWAEPVEPTRWQPLPAPPVELTLSKDADSSIRESKR